MRNLSSAEVQAKSDARTTRVTCEFVSDGTTSEVWFEVESADISPCVSYDPFFLPALLCCMKTGEHLVVEGAVSRRLAMAVWNGLQTILMEQMPYLRQATAHAELVDRPPARDRGAITGISLGVDSLVVIERFLHSEVDADSSIRALVFNDVGSHGATDTDKVYSRRRRRAAEYAESLNLPLVLLKSNMDDVIPWSFEETHSIRNFSAALLLQSSFDKFYYASAYHNASMKVGPFRDIAYADSFLFPLLSTEALTAYTVGADMTRLEKTFLLSDSQVARQNLDVCVTAHMAEGFTNCSQCFKCLRTMVTLEMAGKLGEFSNVFDLKHYRRRKRHFIVNQLYSEANSFHDEIIDYACNTGYNFNLGRIEFAILRARAAVRRAYWRVRLGIPPSFKVPLRRFINRLSSRHKQKSSA